MLFLIIYTCHFLPFSFARRVRCGVVAAGVAWRRSGKGDTDGGSGGIVCCGTGALSIVSGKKTHMCVYMPPFSCFA
jgi:hypothetical protein